jgi:hypothetical protein
MMNADAQTSLVVQAALLAAATFRQTWGGHNVVMHGSSALARYVPLLDLPKDLDLMMVPEHGDGCASLDTQDEEDAEVAALNRFLEVVEQELRVRSGSDHPRVSSSIKMIRGRLFLLQLQCCGRKIVDVMVVPRCPPFMWDTVQVVLPAMRARVAVNLLTLSELRARMHTTVTGVGYADYSMPILDPKTNVYAVTRAAKRLAQLEVMQKAGFVSPVPCTWVVCDTKVCEEALEVWRATQEPAPGAPASVAALALMDAFLRQVEGLQDAVAKRMQAMSARVCGTVEAVRRAREQALSSRKRVLKLQRKQHTVSLQQAEHRLAECQRSVCGLQVQREDLSAKIEALESERVLASRTVADLESRCLHLEEQVAKATRVRIQDHTALLVKFRRSVVSKCAEATQQVERAAAGRTDFVFDVADTDVHRALANPHVASAVRDKLALAMSVPPASLGAHVESMGLALTLAKRACQKACPYLMALLSPGPLSAMDAVTATGEMEKVLGNLAYTLIEAGLCGGSAGQGMHVSDTMLKRMQVLVTDVVKDVTASVDLVLSATADGPPVTSAKRKT